MIRWILASTLCAFLSAIVVFHSEGIKGLKLFFAVKAWLFVFILPLIVTAGAFGLRSFWQAFRTGISGLLPEGGLTRQAAVHILSFYRQVTWAGGILAATLGLILMLVTIEDVITVPRRMAFALVAVTFSIFIAEFLIAPLEARLSLDNSGERDRSYPHLSGLFTLLFLISAFLVVMLCFMMALR